MAFLTTKVLDIKDDKRTLELSKVYLDIHNDNFASEMHDYSMAWIDSKTIDIMECSERFPVSPEILLLALTKIREARRSSSYKQNKIDLMNMGCAV